MQLRLIENSKLVPKGYDAITLYPYILFAAKIDPELLAHEMVHVEQINKLGVVRFYVLYFYYFLKNLRKYKNKEMAYQEIPFEKEAYGDTDPNKQA